MRAVDEGGYVMPTNTSLMLHMDTNLVDSSYYGHTITTNSNAGITSTISKFGSGSCYFDGLHDRLSISSHESLDMGTGNFTLDFWYYEDQLIMDFPTLVFSTDSWTSGAFGIRCRSQSNYKVYVLWYNSSPWITSKNYIYSGQWHHIALVRPGTTISLYVDGYLEGSNTSSAAIDLAAGGTFNIGGYETPGTTSFNGYIDEIRLNKGSAIWTSDFIPPTAAYDLSYYIPDVSVNMVKDFKFEGGDVDPRSSSASWTTICSGTASMTNVWQTYNFDNNVSYKYYRLYVENTHGGVIKLKEWKMFESISSPIQTEKKKIGMISLKPSDDYDYFPKTMDIMASNDGVNWDTLASGVATYTPSEDWQYFEFTNTSYYYQYRLNFSGNWGEVNDKISIAEWSMHEEI